MRLPITRSHPSVTPASLIESITSATALITFISKHPTSLLFGLESVINGLLVQANSLKNSRKTLHSLFLKMKSPSNEGKKFPRKFLVCSSFLNMSVTKLIYVGKGKENGLGMISCEVWVKLDRSEMDDGSNTCLSKYNIGYD